jgi:HD-GYP domain-containing protein (c-di-GMP phosphodiesterase class II)
MSYVLIHADTLTSSWLAPFLEMPEVATHRIQEAHELVPDHSPTVFVLDPGSRAAFPVEQLRAFVDAGGAIVALGSAGETDVPEALPTELLSAFVPPSTGWPRMVEIIATRVRGSAPRPGGVRQLLVAVRAAFREAAARAESGRARKEALLRGSEVTELTSISSKLMTERDPTKLMDDILTQARRFSQSDAGSLYLVETNDDGVKLLRFKWAQNFSKPDVPFKETTIRMDGTSSLAGYAATTGEPLVFDDVYSLPPDAGVTFDRSFDERYGYRTTSMLMIPMKDHKDVVIGVLQLINRKKDFNTRLATLEDVQRQVVAYSKRTVDLVMALAGQAAVAIENSNLYKEIENLFEGFVTAAVHAIEQRDPVTQGHSRRVATFTVGLAEVVDGVRDGPYRNVHFSREQLRELKYAGLLHDFGKVGVREEVLQKAKKLYPGGIDLIRERHAFLVRTAEREFWRRRTEYLQQRGDAGYDVFLRDLEATHARELADLDRFLEIVARANEPQLLAGEASSELQDFATRSYESLGGDPRPFLTPDEVRFLTIPRGSLDDAERKEIENHVNHTFRFLQKIPWTRELRRVPDIAFGHHEKLNGAGYPRHITADDIPPETRMMTISDIFDALTAADRPYKKDHKVGPDYALTIMERELVKPGQLDDALFRLFVGARVFERAPAAD